MAATLTSQGEQTETVWASFPIEKVESDHDGNVLVWGKATDDSLDSDAQIVDPDFAAKAIDEWMESGPNVRVQHQAQRDPAGVGVSFERDGSAHWVKSRIIEPVAKQLVLGGALRAYSVGIARPTIVRDGAARGGRITDGQIVEISLVDRPANKNCGIQLVKGAGGALMTKVFGGDDVLVKMNGQIFEGGDVTVTLPHDVQVGFSPADLAKIVGHRNGNGFLPKAQGVYGAPATESFLQVPVPDDLVKRKLTTEARNALPDSAFVFPDTREYPFHDKKHARNALARVEQRGTPDEKAKVRAAVASRYPGIEVSKKSLMKAAVAAVSKSATAMTSPQTLPTLSPKCDDPADEAVSAALNAAQAAQALDTDSEKAGAAMNPTQSAPASMKKKKSLCGTCGAVQNRKHAFCSECGKAMMGAPEIAKNHDFLCLGCGHELDKGEKHCPDCGRENPGYNPMADQKIPANKADGSRVADDVTQAVTDQDGETVVKAKKAPKKGKDRKGGKPFGGNQAVPFGKKPDDGDADDAKKQTGDAPLTQAKVSKGKKVKPSKPVATGSTPGSASGATGEGGESSVPGHRAGEGQEFDRDAAKGAPPEVATQLRLKALGIDTAMGYAHDLTCAAYSWEDVAKSYPSGLALMDADEWQRKALAAASTAPLPEATAMSRVGQAAFAIKSAQVQDLIDVKTDLYKAFKDANPGPGSAPTPGEISADRYSRPHITAGRASYGAHYAGPHSAPVPPEHGMSAQSFHREPLHGDTTTSPANIVGKNRAPVPDPPGVVMNLDYSSIMKEQIVAAMDAMHGHFDRIFPGVCPMNSSYGRAAHPVAAVKAETDAEVTKKVSRDGMTKKQRAKRDAKLTRAVMKGKMPLDQARIKMGKKPKTSPQPLSPAKGQGAEIIKGEVITAPPVLTKKDLRAALVRAQKSTDKKLTALAGVVSALADQPDPGTQPWKGIAMNPMRTKSAAPAAVQSVAEAAERSQMMVMHQLEQTARNSTNPSEREAAWQQVNKMRGLIPS